MSTSDPTLEQKDGRSNPIFFLIGLAGLLILVAAVFFSGGLDTGQEETTTSGAAVTGETAVLPSSGGPLTPGDLAYDFTLQDLDGDSVHLNELVGQPVIINFWATWCAPCRIEMPELESAYADYRDAGLIILALNQDESPQAVDRFFNDEFGLSFTPLLDEGKAVAERYGVSNILPTTFFINADGEITAVHRGPMVKEQIDGYLADTIPSS